MTAKGNNFELDFQNQKINVYVHQIANQKVFRIIFPDRTPPLNITRAQHYEAHQFWTSIPEGRQKEAEEIGELISKYLSVNQ